MSVLVLRADARHLPLPDASVDLVVTSPPYFGLRSYTDNGEHYAGQIGSEATPAEWLANLVECTREWVRVLKPSGSIFVNLGDKYWGKQPGDYSRDTQPLRDSPRSNQSHRLTADSQRGARRVTWGESQPKSLLGLPWRYALACTDQTNDYARASFYSSLLDAILRGALPHDEARRLLDEFHASDKSKGLGLILRRDIIWSKPNGLPESVTDRCRSSHEYVFHLVRQPRYYAAVDEIREPHAYPGDTGRGWNRSRNGRIDLHDDGTRKDGNAFGGAYSERHLNPLGKLPGSVWSIPSQPLVVPAHLGVDHFAAFPLELPRRIIAGWSPPGVCTACGEGRRPVVDRVTSGHDNRLQSRGDGCRTAASSHAPWNSSKSFWAFKMAGGGDRLTGYACACPQPDAPTRPSLVVDPFGGTGTTALMAAALGRHGLSFDLSADYCRLAAWRTTDRAEIAKAMQVPKPPPVMDGQEALFTL